LNIKRGYFNALDPDKQLELIKKDGNLIMLLDNKPPEFCEAAVIQKTETLVYIPPELRTLRLLLITIMHWKNTVVKHINDSIPNSDFTPESYDCPLSSMDKRVLSRTWLSADISVKKVSIYSGLSGEELDSINKKWTSKYGTAFKEEQNLKKIIETFTPLQDRKNELFELQQFLREWFFRQIREITLLVYLSMEKRNDFGKDGKKRLQISYCRDILNIPPNRHVDPFDISALENIMGNLF
jgi:hypothetical protein